MSKKIYYFLAIGFLVLLNIYLMVSIAVYQRKIENVKSLMSEDTLIKNNNLHVVSDSLNFTNKQFDLVAVFTHTGYILCARHETQQLSKLYHLKKDLPINIYFIGNKKTNYLNEFNLPYKFKIIKSEESLFNKNIYINNPSFFVIDKNGLVLLSYVSNPNFPSRSNVFFEKAKSLLKVK